MVNKRYQKGLDGLTGLAKVIVERQLARTTPPFAYFQKKYAVPEKEKLDSLPFVVGDRVQMIRGPERNKIGIVRSVYENGNSFLVEGLGTTEKLVMPKQVWAAGHSKAVVTAPVPISYKDLRLVTKVRHEDGTEEDVAIHSIEYKGTAYDEHTNSMRPIRRAAHDSSIVIPYPRGDPVKPSKPELATSADIVDERTHFVTSIQESPIPIGALDQIRNPFSRFRRAKDVRRLTEKDVAKWAKPQEMPLTPATRELLEKLAKLPAKPSVPFSKDVEAFIGKEVERGLQRRAKEETAALPDYR